MTRRSFSIDSLVLIFSIIILAQVLVYVIPQGTFERQPYPENPDRSMVVAGSFETTAPEQQVNIHPLHFLLAVPKGFAAAQDIIFLVFITGGVIAILRASGAIDAVLHKAVVKFGRNPWILIGGCLVMFSLGSFTIGMGEEYVPLIPIIVTMSLAMRMDAIVAMGMVWIPYGIGWACAGTNPFGVIIAQNIANVPITSGWEFRLMMMAAFLTLAFHHIYRYAIKVQRNPAASLVAHIDYSEGFDLPQDTALNGPRIAILIVFNCRYCGLRLWRQCIRLVHRRTERGVPGHWITGGGYFTHVTGRHQPLVHQRCSGYDGGSAADRFCPHHRGRAGGRPGY